MAKRKPKKTTQESIEDLNEIAQESNIPDGAFDDELFDACESAAKLQHETICQAPLLEQLEFLYAHGYGVSRLRELLEAAREE